VTHRHHLSILAVRPFREPAISKNPYLCDNQIKQPLKRRMSFALRQGFGL
jgi:hypothetical protein